MSQTAATLESGLLLNSFRCPREILPKPITPMPIMSFAPRTLEYEAAVAAMAARPAKPRRVSGVIEGIVVVMDFAGSLVLWLTWLDFPRLWRRPFDLYAERKTRALALSGTRNSRALADSASRPSSRRVSATERNVDRFTASSPPPPGIADAEPSHVVRVREVGHRRHLLESQSGTTGEHPRQPAQCLLDTCCVDVLR